MHQSVFVAVSVSVYFSFLWYRSVGLFYAGFSMNTVKCFSMQDLVWTLSSVMSLFLGGGVLFFAVVATTATLCTSSSQHLMYPSRSSLLAGQLCRNVWVHLNHVLYPAHTHTHTLDHFKNVFIFSLTVTILVNAHQRSECNIRVPPYQGIRRHQGTTLS